MMICVVGCFLVGEEHRDTPASRPNVLLICVDDLKPALGCYGDSKAKSPNIDRLAAGGMLFRNAYCNQAVCAPSRNSLLTGFRPQSLGIYDLATNLRKAKRDIVTLPQYFKQSGYRTESLGKIFHVGHGNVNDEVSWSVPSWNGKVIEYVLPESGAASGLTREEALFANDRSIPIEKLPKGAAIEVAEVADEAYSDGRLADRAIARLQYAMEHPSEPFFLAVGFAKPHLPFCAPKKYWDLYDPEKFELAVLKEPPAGAPDYAPTKWGELRQYRGVPDRGALDEQLQRQLIHGYYASMSFMDAQVGRVLDALERNRLKEKTIVVLWGDHGWHLGDHGMWSKHSNYEQATRIPLIVSAPGTTSHGVSEAMIESVDLYPTLAELAGLDTPQGLDGVSYKNVIEKSKRQIRQYVSHVFPRGERLGRAIRTERYRLVQWKRVGEEDQTAEWELYDYQADPLETRNLYSSASRDVLEELKRLLAEQDEALPQIRR
jgi:iduronate 2-sulfatase